MERKRKKKRDKKKRKRAALDKTITMVKSHVECSSELVWQCVKKNNAYVRASVNRTRFSAERGNVTSKHGFSSSGATQIFFCGDLSFFLLAPSAGSFPSFFVQRKREGGKERRTRPPFLSHNARSLISHSLSHSLSHSFSLSLSSITVMLSYFLALATRPAL